MMQTKHNQLHEFSTLEEQFTIGKCEQFKGFSSLGYSRQFLKQIDKYSTLKTNLSRKASKSHYLAPYAPGTSGIYLTLVSVLFICNKYRTAFWNLLQEKRAMMCQHT